MNISRALQHLTQDRDYISKLAIASLLSTVPILNFAVSGYALEHTGNVMAGQEVPLPSWDNLGAKFSRGLTLAIAQLVYFAPVLLLYGCFFIFVIGGAGLAGNADTRQQERTIAAILGVGSFAMVCVGGLITLAISLLLPGVYRQYYKHGTFGACFKFGEVLAFTRRRIGDILLAWLTLGGIGLVIGFGNVVLQFIPCLGTLAGLALSLAYAGYVHIVNAHLMAQMIEKDDAALTPRAVATRV